MKRVLMAIFHPRKTVLRFFETVRLPETQNKVAADAQSFWSRSDKDHRLRDLSHWQGEGRWVHEESWRQIGRNHFKMFQQLCLLAERKEPVRSMVEWGPGGGANAVVFCAEVSEIYGVDISAENLVECRRQLDKSGVDPSLFRPVIINASKPDDCLKYITKPVDFFLSTAVYQHFPSKDYGVHVIKIAHSCLGTDGLALIQTRFDDGSEVLRSKNRDYEKNAITFTSYKVEEFWRITEDVGFKPLSIILVPAACYAYYLLRKGE